MALYPKILTLSSQNRFSQEVGALAGTPGLHGPAGLTPGHPLLGPTQAPSSGPACFRGPGGHFVKGRELEGRCLRPSSLRVPGTPGSRGAAAAPAPRATARALPRAALLPEREGDICHPLPLSPSALRRPDGDLFLAWAPWHSEQGGHWRPRQAIMDGAAAPGAAPARAPSIRSRSAPGRR